MKKYERTFLLVMALLGFGFSSIATFHNISVNDESARISREANEIVVEYNKLVEEYNDILEESQKVNETNIYLKGLIDQLKGEQ